MKLELIKNGAVVAEGEEQVSCPNFSAIISRNEAYVMISIQLNPVKAVSYTYPANGLLEMINQANRWLGTSKSGYKLNAVI